jgi:glycosyltransferase involved in cell wall biosynthesis
MTSALTVFLGIYNGERYLESIKQQLLGQTNRNFNILVVDNCSTDNSWKKLQDWTDVFGSSLTLIRNEKNVGAGGSLGNALKKNLIETEWFAMMHQDDFYLENHFDSIIQEINRSGNEIVGICTLMGSMDNEGETQPSRPRAAWLIDDESQINSFLVNLRLQAFSFPTAAVRTNVFSDSFAQWHSPSFSDTETTLNLVTRGKLRYLKVETMRYRENPESESHVINSLESTIGASLGITRVVTSSDFRKFVKSVGNEDRGKFYLELISGIENRIMDSSLREYVKILATEECSYAWEYLEPESTKSLTNTFCAIGSNFTSSMLANRIGMDMPSLDKNLEQTLRSFSANLGEITFGHNKISKSNQKYRKLISIFPLKVRMLIFKIYVRLRAVKQPTYYWNVFWK